MKKELLIVLAVVLVVAGYFGYMSWSWSADMQKKRAEAVQADQEQEHKRNQEEQQEQEQREQAQRDRNAALASIHFDADPDNKLPVFTIDELTKRVWDKRNPLTFNPSDRVRIIATLTDDNIYQSSLTFRASPAQFLYQTYDVVNFSPEALTTLQPGDAVELVALFDYDQRTDEPGDKYAAMKMRFEGLEVHKIPGY